MILRDHLPRQYETAYQLGVLQATVEMFLAKRITRCRLRDGYARVRWYQTAAAVSLACRMADAAERRGTR